MSSDTTLMTNVPCTAVITDVVVSPPPGVMRNWKMVSRQYGAKTFVTSVAPVTPLAARVLAKRPAASRLRPGDENIPTHASRNCISAYGLALVHTAILRVVADRVVELAARASTLMTDGHCARKAVLTAAIVIALALAEVSKVMVKTYVDWYSGEEKSWTLLAVAPAVESALVAHVGMLSITYCSV